MGCKYVRMIPKYKTTALAMEAKSEQSPDVDFFLNKKDVVNHKNSPRGYTINKEFSVLKTLRYALRRK